MEKTRAVVIADAGPIIHLDELNSLDLLADFDKVIVPETVWNEVEQHRPQALVCSEVKFIRQCAVHFSAQVDALTPFYTLHAGEQEALHLCFEFSNSLLLTDDTAARLAAKNLGVAAHVAHWVYWFALFANKPAQNRAYWNCYTLFQHGPLYTFALLYWQKSSAT
ncbi:MAG: hypothetical protein Q8L79_01550 [Methylobacter sp.]|uniref:hypothetical protein n=1 Tax=Methylobacter sp. TaxID=2051955 RepID=UPI00273118DB|nr:hypothetical protein [Methylobacter sp.]MDP1663783.1 hypothetical protein [Methylobacter sp.]MDP1970147.1 hypothetical protein [Methylobacter sp.]